MLIVLNANKVGRVEAGQLLICETGSKGIENRVNRKNSECQKEGHKHQITDKGHAFHDKFLCEVLRGGPQGPPNKQ